MKTLQRLCAATVLTLMLMTATLAGEINTPGVAQPSPTPGPALAMAVCEIPNCDSTSMSNVDLSASDSLTDFALDLLQIMLAVF